ncbi:MAG TPA: hypothetical protein DEB06_03505 [Phycisphaerales bacterium]|nr:hypothetical protein [Phycisphaerales bacterium]
MEPRRFDIVVREHATGRLLAKRVVADSLVSAAEQGTPVGEVIEVVRAMRLTFWRVAGIAMSIAVAGIAFGALFYGFGPSRAPTSSSPPAWMYAAFVLWCVAVTVGAVVWHRRKVHREDGFVPQPERQWQVILGFALCAWFALVGGLVQFAMDEGGIRWLAFALMASMIMSTIMERHFRQSDPLL